MFDRLKPGGRRRWWRVALIVAVAGCSQAVLTPRLFERNSVPEPDVRDTLKVHMRSGELYMLGDWSVTDSGRTLAGHGRHYDIDRVGGDLAVFSVPIDSVSLFETNSHDETFTLGLQGVAALGVIGTAASVACIADPKSCFGSCPTFYAEGDDPGRVRAEGFSASVARVLEARDVDALGNTGAHGATLALHMRNEALETQLIRSVSVLAVPRPPGGRVFATGDSVFYPASELTAPSSCVAPEGDCLHAVAAFDDEERSSPSDSTDLAARETIELTFARSPAHAGLVLGARNSLVTTFLFYQTMAYVGSKMGDMLASMERGSRDAAESTFGMAHILGGIEVQVAEPDGTWRTVGTYLEAGPIAADVKVIPLPSELLPHTGSLKVRLRMAKGSWRVGWAALAELGAPVVPTRVPVARVERDGRPDSSALATLLDGNRRLVTLPGDEYRLLFKLPQPAEQLELFLETEGYYYEWMRREWLAEENPMLAALVVANPSAGLRLLAPAYKAREPHMEELFWNSRFNRRPSHATR